MAQNRFWPYMAVSRPSWIGCPRKNNSAFHFEVLSIKLKFQPNPSSVYRGRKNISDWRIDRQMDGRMDGQDKNIYSSSPLGGGIIRYCCFKLRLALYKNLDIKYSCTIWNLSNELLVCISLKKSKIIIWIKNLVLILFGSYVRRDLSTPEAKWQRNAILT